MRASRGSRWSAGCRRRRSCTRRRFPSAHAGNAGRCGCTRLIEPEMSAEHDQRRVTSRGERNFGRINSPPVRSAARIMARGSMRAAMRRRPRSAASATMSKGSAQLRDRLAWPRRSRPAFIWAKSLPRSTSLPEKVSGRRPRSPGFPALAGSSGGPRTSRRPTRLLRRRGGFCFSRVGRHRRKHRQQLLDQLARFQNSRKASSKVGMILVPLTTSTACSVQ